MINNIPKETYDVLLIIINELVTSSFHLSINTTIHGVNFTKSGDLYLIDVILIKSGTWISEIGGSYHEDCYKVSFSYNHMYYSHVVPYTTYSQHLRDYKVNQIIES